MKLKSTVIKEITYLPSPMSISIWWNMGSIMGLMLFLQILTGFFLSMHYTANIASSFESVIHIIRDVPMGWLVRSLHANGASFFFVFMYLHIARGLYYQSYITQPKSWMVGTSIFLLSMATAFLGYVLPWGQMSFWGATVITNFLSAIPYVGGMVVEWVWGGFSIGQATLNRFYSLHFILPFIIMILAMLHLVFLHEKGSTNPLGCVNHLSKVPFHPYFTWKDSVGFITVLMMLIFVSLYFPNYLGDPENYQLANSMVTPVHIMPEWYFLFAYAILRSIPSKLGGVIALAASIMVLYVLPMIKFEKMISTSFNLMYQVLFWLFCGNFMLLTWLGSCPIEAPYSTLAVPMTFMYFFLLFLMPFSSILWKNALEK
nr:Cytochrome b oxydase [Physella acuta]CAH2593503.1 Cytochrome b oxydase [Physella acuta]CAH2594168.1 Cytochrome b oxydase [Physella acuta]